MKKLIVSMFFVLTMIVLAACGGANNDGNNNNNNDNNNNEENVNVENDHNENNSSDNNATTDNDGATPVVTMTMEDGGEVQMELYTDIAPTSVNNFITLIEDGFYDGVIFHRVIPGFMIQGGDPEGTGMGGPGYYIKGEFAENDFENNLKHERGVLSMARSMHPDSAGSQFFIMVEDSPHLDGEYAGFGKVIEGMDVVDEIVSVDRDEGEGDRPYEDQVIEKMTVELNEI